jgi:hypothetical protein
MIRMVPRTEAWLSDPRLKRRDASDMAALSVPRVDRLDLGSANEIDLPAVLAVLMPIWQTKQVTAQ